MSYYCGQCKSMVKSCAHSHQETIVRADSTPTEFTLTREQALDMAKSTYEARCAVMDRERESLRARLAEASAQIAALQAALKHVHPWISASEIQAHAQDALSAQPGDALAGVREVIQAGECVHQIVGALEDQNVSIADIQQYTNDIYALADALAQLSKRFGEGR